MGGTNAAAETRIPTSQHLSLSAPWTPSSSRLLSPEALCAAATRTQRAGGDRHRAGWVAQRLWNCGIRVHLFPAVPATTRVHVGSSPLLVILLVAACRTQPEIVTCRHLFGKQLGGLRHACLQRSCALFACQPTDAAAPAQRAPSLSPSTARSALLRQGRKSPSQQVRRSCLHLQAPMIAGLAVALACRTIAGKGWR